MADPVIGQLFNSDLIAPIGQLPTPLQPGGIGTPVTEPVQTLGELNGMFRPGCGHSIRSYEVIQDTVQGQVMMVVRCPLCGYVQAIQSQATFYNPVNSILIA